MVHEIGLTALRLSKRRRLPQLLKSRVLTDLTCMAETACKVSPRSGGVFKGRQDRCTVADPVTAAPGCDAFHML